MKEPDRKINRRRFVSDAGKSILLAGFASNSILSAAAENKENKFNLSNLVAKTEREGTVNTDASR